MRVKSVFETSVMIDDEPSSSALDIESAKAKISELMAPLTPDQRRNVAHKLQRQYKDEIVRHQSGIEIKKARLAVLTKQKEVAERIGEWVDRPVKLERNDCSRFHKLCEAVKVGAVLSVSEDGDIDTIESYKNITDHYSHVFVVKHDWANGFGDSIGTAIAEEWRLPYDLCAFEFLISGYPVIVLAIQDETIARAVAFICINGVWGALGHVKSNDCKPLMFAWEQVRAICIALDAEVASSTVERAPAKLNEKRIKAGKVPLCDYHVVDLARRRRINAFEAVAIGHRKRLHFRRGHWRHFETHKTWIKWMLVGNPELGFISSEYAL